MADSTAHAALKAYIEEFGTYPREAKLLVQFSQTRDDLKTVSLSEAQTTVDLYHKRLGNLHLALKSGTKKFTVSRKHIVDVEEKKSQTPDSTSPKSIFESNSNDTPVVDEKIEKWDKKELKAMEDNAYDNPSYENVSDQMNASLLEQQRQSKKENSGFFACCLQIFRPQDDEMS